MISEIMYDPLGGDDNHEWIEIKNGTANSVDLSEWDFFEANTNHSLTLAQGNATVPAGGFAIIAEDAAQFLVDFPSFTGALFDSSFALANTTETIAIKDGSGTIVDEVTYSSEQGATNDGNSLQKAESGWIAATPNPGI